MSKNFPLHQKIFLGLTAAFTVGLCFVLPTILTFVRDDSGIVFSNTEGTLLLLVSICLLFAAIYIFITGIILSNMTEHKNPIMYLGLFTFYYFFTKIQYCPKVLFFIVNENAGEALIVAAHILAVIAVTMFISQTMSKMEVKKGGYSYKNVSFCVWVAVLPFAIIISLLSSDFPKVLKVITISYMILYAVRSITLMTKKKRVVKYHKSAVIMTSIGGVVLLIDILPMIFDAGSCQLATIGAIAMFTLVTYIWIYMLRNIYLGIEEANDVREQLMESKVQLMLSQIKPHFIYNALNSINILIPQNPEKAQNMVKNFSDYLRQNMNAMNSSGLIPFMEELEHIRAYVGIEVIRFPKVAVQYEIDERDFLVPILSVEPLVENAIKHGVARKRDGGYVKIRAYRSGSFIYIEVKDNGIGFDVEQAMKNEASIGIRNVRYRVEQITGGSLRLTSEKNVGTQAIIKLPISQVKKA